MEQSILGVDVGGVIISRVGNRTFFSDNYLKAPAVRGAFDALHKLVAERFNGRVFLVSQCDQIIREKTLRWFECRRFHETTGIPPGNIHFCHKQIEKAHICQELGVTHFIDDKPQVLRQLTSVGNLYLFNPRSKYMHRFGQYLDGNRVRRVKTWRGVLRHLL